MSSFGAGIEDLLAPLKQRLEALEDENRALKAQLSQAIQELAEIKCGAGITVYVNGKPVATSASVTPDVAPGQMPYGASPMPGAPYAAPAILNDRRPPTNPPAAGGTLFPQTNRVSASNPGSGSAPGNAGSAKPGGYSDFFLD